MGGKGVEDKSAAGATPRFIHIQRVSKTPPHAPEGVNYPLTFDHFQQCRAGARPEYMPNANRRPPLMARSSVAPRGVTLSLTSR